MNYTAVSWVGDDDCPGRDYPNVRLAVASNGDALDIDPRVLEELKALVPHYDVQGALIAELLRQRGGDPTNG